MFELAVKMIKPLSLAHFQLGIFLANDIQAPLALDDLAIFASLFDGCSDFHRF